MNVHIPPTALLLSAALAAGCWSVSTEYTPKDPNRTSIIMRDNATVIVRGSRELPFQQFVNKENEATAFFSCDPRAAAAASQSASDFRSAMAWGPAAMGLIPAFIIRKYDVDGTAEFVDAINLQNESPACIGR